MRLCIEIPYMMFGISPWWTVTGEQSRLAPHTKCFLQPKWITSPLASHPCQDPPSFTFPTDTQCTTLCHKGLKSWYYDTMQGGIKERKKECLASADIRQMPWVCSGCTMHLKLRWSLNYYQVCLSCFILCLQKTCHEKAAQCYTYLLPTGKKNNLFYPLKFRLIHFQLAFSKDLI